MQSKKEAAIAEKMKKLQNEKRQAIKDKNLELGLAVSKAIKVGNLNLDDILKAIDGVTKSKKSRGILGLDQSQKKDTDKPPPLPERNQFSQQS